MTAYSLLDLVPVREGGTLTEAFANAAAIAAHAESLGFTRYWVAEHHGMEGIASAATAVVLAHVGQATRTIRIGAGGIMLPNHSPLQIAEQFGTLDALFPGRIDLGLGRAPGSDQRVAAAIRRGLANDPDGFPRDVIELQQFLAGRDPGGVRATPGAGADVPLWILGSSLFGARLAAMLGLPYAFASHFAPAMLDEAIAIYRETFRPSAALARPHVMLGFNLFAADTDGEAEMLASSQQQAFVALRTTGRGIKLPPPVSLYRRGLSRGVQDMLDQVLAASAIGSPATVAEQVAAFVKRTGADELMLTSPIYDQQARKRSLTIAAEVMAGLRTPVEA